MRHATFLGRNLGEGFLQTRLAAHFQFGMSLCFLWSYDLEYFSVVRAVLVVIMFYCFYCLIRCCFIVWLNPPFFWFSPCPDTKLWHNESGHCFCSAVRYSSLPAGKSFSLSSQNFKITFAELSYSKSSFVLSHSISDISLCWCIYFLLIQFVYICLLFRWEELLATVQRALRKW